MAARPAESVPPPAPAAVPQCSEKDCTNPAQRRTDVDPDGSLFYRNCRACSEEITDRATASIRQKRGNVATFPPREPAPAEPDPLAGIDPLLKDWAANDAAVKRAIAATAVDHDLQALGIGRRFSGKLAEVYVDQRAAVKDGPPWITVDGAAIIAPAPWSRVGRGLLCFAERWTSVVGHPKVGGKTTMAWADLAPVTHQPGVKVIAIVGDNEMGGGHGDYLGTVASLGADPAGVLLCPAVPGILARILANIDGIDVRAVVVDSADSLTVALGRNVNARSDTEQTIGELRAICPAGVIVRHPVNSPNSKERDPLASAGAGSGGWFACVDAEGALKRDDRTSVVRWRGRDGCPTTTAYTLDKTRRPYGVEVIDAADVPAADVTPNQQAAVLAVLEVLQGRTEADPVKAKQLQAALCPSGEDFRPYRDVLGKLFDEGMIRANRDPSARLPGVPLKLWEVESADDSAPARGAQKEVVVCDVVTTTSLGDHFSAERRAVQELAERKDGGR